MNIPEPNNSISALIDKDHEDRSELPRPHLGCSLLGHDCDRYLWLQFRWAAPEKFKGRILRLFRRGQDEEEKVVSDLRAIGVDVQATGKSQSRVDFGSHVSGSVDGIVQHIPQAPKAKAILEIKTHSDKSFKTVEKEGVKKAHYKHWAQMQLYMLGMQLDRALYFAVNKNDDSIYTEWLHIDKDAAQKLVERGHRITLSDRMPEPISADPSWYACQYCPSHDLCHVSKLTKQVNCRTCAMSTPLSDSTWHCAKWDDIIPTEAQHDGCPSHVLHPDMVPWQRQDSDSEWQAVYVVKGKSIKNGERADGVFSSKELISNLDACLSNDNYLMEMRKTWDGEIVG